MKNLDIDNQMISDVEILYGLQDAKNMGLRKIYNSIKIPLTYFRNMMELMVEKYGWENICRYLKIGGKEYF